VELTRRVLPPTRGRADSPMKAGAMIVEANSIRQFAARLAAVGLLALPSAHSAHATLGGVEATVLADQSQIGATLRTVYGAKYTMHELQVPAGTTVREYIAPTGVVFAVAWQGPSMPDLRQLLGAHFDQYVAAVAARHNVRGPVSIQLPGLVVQSGGRMRSFAGRAYVPESLPQGVSADELQ
jgi:hypothetical protein